VINQAGGKVTFHDVLRMPNATENLLSGQVLLSKKVYPIVHDRNPRLIHDGKTVLTINFANNKQMLYGTEGKRALAGSSDSVEVWHQRYGHLSLPTLNHVSEAPYLSVTLDYTVRPVRKGSPSRPSANLRGTVPTPS